MINLFTKEKMLEDPVAPEQIPSFEYYPAWELQAHSSCLSSSLDFLRQVMHERLMVHFGKKDAFVLPAFSLKKDDSAFSRYVAEKQLDMTQFIMLLLAIAPHAHTDIFGDIIARFLPKGGDFPAFGGVKGSNYRGIIPTGETLFFLLAGTYPEERWAIQSHLFNSKQQLLKEQVVHLETVAKGEPEMSGRLLMDKEFIQLFLTGQRWKPAFGGDFPAKLLETKMEWQDLIVAESTRKELELLRSWLNHHLILMQDEHLKKKLKPGCRALFYGPPGTGKTLTAALLGNEFGLDVYRIDLSQVVSKYIGETEKNLQLLFETAEHKDWILFFDEADALFGKRTNVSSSHDRFANQEVAFLLQRVEDYDGLVILASNLKSNLDQAFMRRFQSVIFFPVPDQKERLLLWKNTIPASIPLDENIQLEELSRQYELTGASILNIVQMASLRALANGGKLTKSFLLEEIKKEYLKESKSI